MNPNIRNKLREWSSAFKSGDSNIYKKAKNDLRKAIKTAKTNYKNKLETQFRGSGTRRMWQGLRAITDYKGSSGGVTNTELALAAVWTLGVPVSFWSVLQVH